MINEPQWGKMSKREKEREREIHISSVINSAVVLPK